MVMGDVCLREIGCFPPLSGSPSSSAKILKSTMWHPGHSGRSVVGDFRGSLTAWNTFHSVCGSQPAETHFLIFPCLTLLQTIFAFQTSFSEAVNVILILLHHLSAHMCSGNAESLLASCSKTRSGNETCCQKVTGPSADAEWLWGRRHVGDGLSSVPLFAQLIWRCL